MASSQHLLFLAQTKEEAGTTMTGTSYGPQCWVGQRGHSSLVGAVVGEARPTPSHLAKVLGTRRWVRGIQGYSHITEALDSAPGLMVAQG